MIRQRLKNPKFAKSKTEVRSSTKATVWVAVGASAGGLESITSFCQGLSENSDVAYIVAQHFSPNHKSMLTELIQQKIGLKVKTLTSMTTPGSGKDCNNGSY